MKKEQFELLNLPNLGLNDFLMVPSSDSAHVYVCKPFSLVYKPDLTTP